MQETKSSFIKKLFGFSMVTWISFAIGFISSPIATRLFTAAEYAKLNKFSTYAALLSSVCYLGLDQAYVRFFHELPKGFSKKGLLTLCSAVALVFSLLLSAVLVLFRKEISIEIVGATDNGIFLCLCAYSFCLVLFRFLSLFYRMNQNIRLYTIQGILHALLTKIAYLAVGFRQPYGKTAILSLTVLMAVFSLIFLFLQRTAFTPHLTEIADQKGIKDILRFSLPIMPLNILAWVNSSITTPLLNRLMNESAVGIYAAALGLASSINIIQSGFNTYWAPYMLEHYHENDRTRFYTVHRMMTCLLTLFGLAITILQVPVFLLLGKDFRSSVIFFPFLFLSPICYCLGETTCMGINISKKTYWTTLIYLFSSVCNIALCLWLIPLLGMTGAAVSSAVSAILTLIFRTILGEHYYKILESPKYLIQSIGLMTIASILNLSLTDFWKYASLALVMMTALFAFRKEIRSLLEIAVSMLVKKKGIKNTDVE